MKVCPTASKAIRARSENWLAEDRDLLLELIKKRLQILENKNTNTDTNVKKKNAWIAVQQSFNTMCRGPPRSVNQLKVQWGHMKMNNNKKRLFAERKDVKSESGVDIEASSRLSPQEDPLIEDDVEDNFELQITGNLDSENPADHNILHNKNKRRGDFAKEKIKEIAKAEMNFERELHRAKIANQKRKARNLDLKYQVLKAKLKYYKTNKDW